MTISAPEVAATMSTKTRLRLWLRLLKISRSVENNVREKLRVEFDSTLPRFDVLAALYQFPKGLRMSELSGLLKVSNGNVTGIVDRLVKDGLIIRTPVPGDRRALRVRLTKRGEEEFALQAAAHERWIDGLLSDVSLDEADHMISSFDQILANMNDKAGEAS
jgi:DNA-binding MarR family transcriptional regulator